MRKYFSISIIVLLLVACNNANAALTGEALTPTVAATATLTPPPLPTIIEPGACQHLLWPLVDGAVWNYQLTLPDGSTQPITVSATVVEASATLTHNIASVATSYHVSCAPDGFYGIAGSLLGYSNLDVGLQLSNPSGPFFPSPDRLLPLGSEAAWDVEYDTGGTFMLPLAEGAIEVQVSEGKVVLFATTEPLETVTVPAGTFDVLPVLQSIFLDLRVSSADGRSGSVIIDARLQIMLAEGLGVVRQTLESGRLSGSLAGEPFGIVLQGGERLDLVAFSG